MSNLATLLRKDNAQPGDVYSYAGFTYTLDCDGDLLCDQASIGFGRSQFMFLSDVGWIRVSQADPIDPRHQLKVLEHDFGMLQGDYTILQAKYDSLLTVLHAAEAYADSTERPAYICKEAYDLEQAVDDHVKKWGRE